MKEITEEEAREFIAKQADWTEHPVSGYYATHDGKRCWFPSLPAYFDDADLEALFWMREAEMTLTPDECFLYERKLVDIIGHRTFPSDGAKAWYWHASSCERAHAILAVHGYKLKETK